MTPSHLRSLQEFEKLFDRYQAASSKKDLMIKKVYAIETYALYSVGDYVIMSTVAHNRTNKDIREICHNIYEDVKLDEQSCFIHKWY